MVSPRLQMILNVEACTERPDDLAWLRRTAEHDGQRGATVVQAVSKKSYDSVDVIHGAVRPMEKAAAVQKRAQPNSFKPMIAPRDFDHAARPPVPGEPWDAAVDPRAVECGVMCDADG